MAEYALVGTDKLVKAVIVADSDFISAHGDEIKTQYGDAAGTWTLTPAKVGLGWKSEDGIFVTKPSDVEVTAPAAVVLSVTKAGGSTYQWKKGVDELSGKTSATLEIDPSATGDSGSYTCVISSGGDSVESEAATVTVNA